MSAEIDLGDISNKTIRLQLIDHPETAIEVVVDSVESGIANLRPIDGLACIWRTDIQRLLRDGRDEHAEFTIEDIQSTQKENKDPL